MTGLRTRADAAAQVFVADVGAPELDEADAHHLVRVLRLRDGEQVVASDGGGAWRICTLAGKRLEPASAVEHEPAPDAAVRVWLPPLKGERSEWAVAKLTELGVDEIGMLVAERAVVRADAGGTTRILARWGRVAREASCQSRRVRLPGLLGPLDVAGAVAAGARRCDLDGEELASDVVAVAIGPEGGWGDAEQLDGPCVSLGATVLRTETAAVAAGVLLVRAARAPRHAAAPEAQ